MAKGKPSKGTPADKRLTANKGSKKPAPKKGGFVPFGKGGKSKGK